MTAIVKDDECSHHETRGREGQQEGQPVRHVQAERHERPHDHEGQDRINHLPETARGYGCLVAGDPLSPG